MDEEEVDEGMAEPAVDTDMVAAAMAGAPMEELLRPIARLLTGQRPEGADTAAEPTEDVWVGPSDTCAAAAAEEEEEEGPDDDDAAAAETAEGNAEECKLESPSTPGC